MRMLTSEQASQLRENVHERLKNRGCDHSHRFTREWVANEGLCWDDLLDLLEASGVNCDCEVVLNLDENAESPKTRPSPEIQVDWRLPPSWTCSNDVVFTKVIVCRAGLGRNTHSVDGEILVPPPFGTNPRKRVRASVHFFVGITSGLPSEVGVVEEKKQISAEDFAIEVRSCQFNEFKTFSSLESAFVLGRISKLPVGTPVGTHFLEISGVVGKREELRIHNVILRP